MQASQVFLIGVFDLKDILNSRQNRSEIRLVGENDETRVEVSCSSILVMGSCFKYVLGRRNVGKPRPRLSLPNPALWEFAPTLKKMKNSPHIVSYHAGVGNHNWILFPTVDASFLVEVKQSS